MIEQAIYFGLGCVVAGLAALGFLPVLWARALRLTRRRLQAQIPVSMQEILADRDHLRAEFAVERRKLEQAMDRVRAGKSKDLSELGRRASEAFVLSESVTALQARAVERDDEITRTARERTEAEAQLGSLQIALHHLHADHDQRLGELEQLRRAYDDIDTLAEQRRTTVAGLHTRTMGLEMTIEDGLRARAALERQLELSKQTIAGLGEENEALSRASALADAPAALDQARGQIVELEAALQEAREREKSFHLQKSLRGRRGDGRAGGKKLAALRSENAALGGAVRQEDSDAATPAVAGDDQLRASIHEIGLAVAAMTSLARSNGHDRQAAAPMVSPPRSDQPAAGASARS